MEAPCLKHQSEILHASRSLDKCLIRDDVLLWKVSSTVVTCERIWIPCYPCTDASEPTLACPDMGLEYWPNRITHQEISAADYTSGELVGRSLS